MYTDNEMIYQANVRINNSFTEVVILNLQDNLSDLPLYEIEARLLGIAVEGTKSIRIMKMFQLSELPESIPVWHLRSHIGEHN